MWDKNKVYGYSVEHIHKYGMPEDNESNIKSNEEERLTQDEIRKMFPNQSIALRDIDWIKPGSPFSGYRSAVVTYYKCSRGDMMLRNFMKDKDVEYVDSVYDNRIGDEYLWSLEKK